jgi:hypothetical protein
MLTTGLFIFFEIVTICFFLGAFFTKQEILWAITSVFSAFLMFNSFKITTYIYQYNATTLIYDAVLVSNSYPYLVGLNTLFFMLSLVLGIFDMFEKYGTKLKMKGK